MSFDLILMGSSADRTAGHVALPIAVGETHYSGNGVPGTGTQIYPKVDSAIAAFTTNCETAATTASRVHTTNDPDWMLTPINHLQTDPVLPQCMNYCNYPIKIGEAIEATSNNSGAGGAVLDVMGIFIDKGKGICYPTMPAKVPPMTTIVRASATFTHVADAVAEGVIAFTNYNLDRTKHYKILGMAAYSATGLFTRLRFIDGPNVNDRPGVIAADTSTALEYQMFYGDFGTFSGMNPPMCQTIAVAADAVTELVFMIQEI